MLDVDGSTKWASESKENSTLDCKVHKNRIPSPNLFYNILLATPSILGQVSPAFISNLSANPFFKK